MPGLCFTRVTTNHHNPSPLSTSAPSPGGCSTVPDHLLLCALASPSTAWHVLLLGPVAMLFLRSGYHLVYCFRGGLWLALWGLSCERQGVTKARKEGREGGREGGSLQPPYFVVGMLGQQAACTSLRALLVDGVLLVSGVCGASSDCRSAVMHAICCGVGVVLRSQYAVLHVVLVWVPEECMLSSSCPATLHHPSRCVPTC
jgi:hypothetical protein